MSYILDALKKSERERPPGAVPDLFTVHGPQLPSPRRPARAIIAGALLLLLPAIGLWSWLGSETRDGRVAPSPPIASPSVRAESAAVPVEPHGESPPTPRAQTTAEGSIPVVSRGPLERRSAAPVTPATPAQKARPAVASSAVPPAQAPMVRDAPQLPPSPPSAEAPDAVAVTAVPIPPPPAPIAPAVLPPPAPQPGGGIPTAPAVESPSAPPAATSPAAPAVASPKPVPDAPAAVFEAVPPADGRAVDLAELPATIRAELPKLLVSGHVWSAEPSLRLLSVDDRLLHEGGEAASGVRLQEITPAGAIFVYKGWRVRVAGARQ